MKLLCFSLLYLLISSCGRVDKVNEFVFGDKDVRLEIVKLKSPINSSLRGISILNDSVAWFSGAEGSIVATLNGGQILSIIPPPKKADSFDFRDVFIKSTSEIVLMSSGNPSRIYKSSDGGTNWIELFSSPHKDLFLDAINFNSVGFGLAYGDPIEGHHYMLSTRNNGLTWDVLSEEFPVESLEGEAAFAASGSSISFTPDNRVFIGLSFKGRILTSQPPYKDWVAIQTPIFQGAPTRGIYSITFKNDSIGVAVGGDYTLPDSIMVENSIYTQDGGKTWLNPQTPLSGYRSCVAYCRPANTFVAIGTNGIDISKDNGVNWTRISNFEKGLNSIQFVENRNFGYMIGSKGEIYKITIY